MKSKKPISIIAGAVMATSACTISASALQMPGYYTNSCTKYHKGSSIISYFCSTLSWPNVVNKCSWNGYSRTYWVGTSPYYADSIKHANCVYVSGVGSFSLATDAAGCEISGSNIIDEMQLTNAWTLDSYYTYTIKRAVAITSTDFSISSRVQFGSTFYSLSCTT